MKPEPALDETVEAEFEDGPARTVSPVIEPEVVEVAALPSLLDDDSGLDLDDDAEVGEGFPIPCGAACRRAGSRSG